MNKEELLKELQGEEVEVFSPGEISPNVTGTLTNYADGNGVPLVQVTPPFDHSPDWGGWVFRQFEIDEIKDNVILLTW